MMSTTEDTIKSPLLAYEIWTMISSNEKNEEDEDNNNNNNVAECVDVTDDSPRLVNESEPIKRSFGLTYTALNTLISTLLLS